MTRHDENKRVGKRAELGATTKQLELQLGLIVLLLLLLLADEELGLYC